LGGVHARVRTPVGDRHITVATELMLPRPLWSRSVMDSPLYGHWLCMQFPSDEMGATESFVMPVT
jgi:hypothetical protein